MTPDEIHDRLTRHEQRISALEKGQVDMTETVTAIQRDTSEIVNLMRDAQGAWRVLELMGKAGKPFAWLATLACAAGLAWAQITGKKT